MPINHNMGDFSRRFEEISRQVRTGATDLQRKVALAIDQTIVLATPVDTGRARANWVVSVEVAFSGVREPYAPGSKGSSGADNAQAAIDQGKAAVGAHQPGQTIFISNNLPYIIRLNQGWSAQAPAGFIEAAVDAGLRAAQEGRLL